MDLIYRLQRHSGLTQTERHLRDYILQNPEQAARMSARELAAASFTSPAAVTRFCRKFGCRSLKAFKAELYREAVPGAAPLPDCNFPFDAATPAEEVTRAVLRLEQESLRRLPALLPAEVVRRAAGLLLSASCIDLYAIGTSGHVSADFAFRMRKIGRQVNLVSDRVEGSYFTRRMDAGHCLLAVSYSGANDQLRAALAAAKKCGAPVIAVTAHADSPAARRADCLLLLPPMESNDAKISTFASAASQKAVLDVLFAHVFQHDYERNAAFVREDAASLEAVRGAGAAPQRTD